MGRLIDADKVIEQLEKVRKESASLVDMVHIIGFQGVIDEQPTAYDPDKVVEQLKKEFKKYYGDNWDKAPYLVKAIEIVKGGGVDG